MHLRPFRALGFVVLLVLPGACGGSNDDDDDDDDDDGGCASIGGVWNLSGTCFVSSCLITQSDCSVVLECDGGLVFNGTVTNTSISFANSTATCDGAIEGNKKNVINGSCSDGCTFTATD